MIEILREMNARLPRLKAASTLTRDEWQAAREQLRDVLLDVAQKGGRIRCPEIFARATEWHFEHDIPSLRGLLTDLARGELEEGRPLLSAVVVPDASLGPDGDLAQIAMELDIPIEASLEAFWEDELGRVHDY